MQKFQRFSVSNTSSFLHQNFGGEWNVLHNWPLIDFRFENFSSDYDLERIISKIEDILNVEPYDAKMCTALFKVLLTHCNFSRMNKRFVYFHLHLFQDLIILIFFFGNSPVNSFYALYLYLTIKQRFGFNEEVKDLDQLWNSYYDTPQIQTSMEFFLQ